ncbi:MAG: phosphatase [Erysipelotrichales bacterium]|nr:phosphatase [Erysipelotrichales bacterium]
MKLIADLHTHTIVSGHAYGTIRENTAAAKEAGLSILGITEHGPRIPGAPDPIYFRNMGNVPRYIYGVMVLMGCELNILNDGTVDLEPNTLSRIDYGIAGIHRLCYKDEGKEKNTENVISAMKYGKVKLISHPDDDHTPLDYDRLTDGAKEYGTALEVNNSSFRKPQFRLNCVENYRTMLRYCKEKHVPVIINSDAHDPSQVGTQSLALAFAEECGMPEELILNTDAQRLLDFLNITDKR